MTVRELTKQEEFTPVHVGEGADREITKTFCCDLLSIAMGRAPEGCAWITVMANMNTLAVSSLADAACIILAEGVHLDETALQKAAEQDISVFETELPIFEAALLVYRRMNGE